MGENRGGKRTGAGRPAIGGRQIRVQLRPDEYNIALELGAGNPGDGVRAALAGAGARREVERLRASFEQLSSRVALLTAGIEAPACESGDGF